MSHPVLYGYIVKFECSECGHKEQITAKIEETFTESSQRHCIDFLDLLDVASDHDFLVGVNGEMVCYNCVEKKHVEASLPTIAEHNPTLKGCL